MYLFIFDYVILTTLKWKAKPWLMNCDFTSSMDDSKFIPKATPIRLNKVREKEPMVSCRPRRIITFRWLESQGCCTESLDLQKALEWSMKRFTTHLKTNVLRFERNAKDKQSFRLCVRAHLSRLIEMTLSESSISLFSSPTLLPSSSVCGVALRE